MLKEFSERFCNQIFRCIMTDIETIELKALHRGDVKAFDKIYNRYHKAVHANILKLVKDSALSAEILQDVFLSLWQNRFKISPEQNVGGWLFVVSYNKSMNALRQKIKESVQYVMEYPEEIADSSTDQEEEEEFILKIHILEEAIGTLTKRKKEVFCLYRYEGFTKEHIAEKLGLSVRSVSNYLKDANKCIREHIAREYPAHMQNVGLYFLISYYFNA